MIEPQYEKPAENDYLKSADSQIETEVAHISGTNRCCRPHRMRMAQEQPAANEANAQPDARASEAETHLLPDRRKNRLPAQKVQEQHLCGKNKLFRRKGFQGKIFLPEKRFC